MTWASNQRSVTAERVSFLPFQIPELSGIFAFAGLWGRWRDRAAGQTLETCTILTTSPNSLVAGVHDRMPVILKTEDYDLWLDPGVTDVARVSDCLRPL